jgi:hypothetical protein
MITLILAALVAQDVVVDVEPVKELKPGKSLGTGPYKAREGEKKFLEKVPEEELVTGSMFSDYSIRGRKGKYVSWFGIVRKIARDKKDEDSPRTLTVEHKYFDGLTDTHIMALSFNGGGDFALRLGKSKVMIDELVLVRAYGKITEEKDNVPTLEAEYLRVWPWKTFTFILAYGKDASNGEWRKLNTVKLDDIYDAYPGDKYYEKRLGARKKEEK